jgi:membrane-associated protein
MVRWPQHDKKKVLLVDAAHARVSVHSGSTLVRLPRTDGPRIMHACGRERLPRHSGRFECLRESRRTSEFRDDLPGAHLLIVGYADSLLAGMRAKPGRFLLPYWLGPAGSSVPLSARREPTAVMLELIQNVVHHLYDVQGLIQWGGTLLVCTIVFVETGLFVGFFLPGDSLLVTAGVFSAAGALKIGSLVALVTLCAIAGDQVGYWIGRHAGQALYHRRDSRFFKRRHLERAHAFYEKYGGKTVILARFMPIVRTFCPPVAGAAEMRYGRFVAFDLVGGCCWGGGLVLAGYFLGSMVPNIGQRIHWVIAVVVILSLLPAFIGAMRARSQRVSRSEPCSLGRSSEQ